MSSEQAINVKNLAKAYQLYKTPADRLKQMLFGKKRQYFSEILALQDINFSIAKGESVGVLGVNGSGKSTLLQILSGNLQPSGGTVEKCGRVCALLELGAGFNPEFTGRENVFFSARLMGMSEAEIQGHYQAIVDFADIGEFIDRPVRCYSSGMYVRLAFSVAAHMEPDILLVDEVLAVGDIFFQQKCNLHMRQRLGRVTKVIVTHSLNTVASMTQRALVLHRGRLVFDGPPLAAIEHYIRLCQIPGDESPPRPGPAASKAVALESMTPIPGEKLSGALNVVMTGYAIETNGLPYEGCVKAGAEVVCTVQIEVHQDIAHPIAGYMLADQYGNALFGQNTVTAGLSMNSLRRGVSRLSLSFTWPDIAHGDYFLTIGIGNGQDAMAHAIECWAHNIFHFSAITPGRDVHGLFNNSLHHVACTPQKA